jgi:predicted nucleotidyltransferase
MKRANIDLYKEKISDFCNKWHVREFALFGSVLHGHFKQDSDVDVMVDFEKGKNITLFDLVTMKDELELIFEREVDLVTRQSVEQSRNYIRRNSILSSVEVVYAA